MAERSRSIRRATETSGGHRRLDADIQATSRKVERILKLETDIGKRAITEYVSYLRTPWRIFWANLLAGLAYGIGFVLGGSVLIALLLFLLARMAQIPVIGDTFEWVAESIRSYGR